LKNESFFLFSNNHLNQPLTEGHFLVIDSNCQDLPWRQSEDAGKFQIFDDAFPIHYPLSFVVSHINGQSGMMGRTQVKFFLPMKEFRSHSVNSHMSINSGACAAMNEVIKTPFIGCVKDGDIIGPWIERPGIRQVRCVKRTRPMACDLCIGGSERRPDPSIPILERVNDNVRILVTFLKIPFFFLFNPIRRRRSR